MIHSQFLLGFNDLSFIHISATITYISTNQILAFQILGEKTPLVKTSEELSVESLNPLFLSSFPPSVCLHHFTDSF